MKWSVRKIQTVERPKNHRIGDGTVSSQSFLLRLWQKTCKAVSETITRDVLLSCRLFLEWAISYCTGCLAAVHTCGFTDGIAFEQSVLVELTCLFKQTLPVSQKCRPIYLFLSIPGSRIPVYLNLQSSSQSMSSAETMQPLQALHALPACLPITLPRYSSV